MCEGGKCVLGSGAGFAIANGFLYAFAALSSFMTPKPKEEGVNARALEMPVVASEQAFATTAAATTESVPGTVVTTETTHPDGSKITERITTLTDGSKLVEETTETPA